MRKRGQLNYRHGRRGTRFSGPTLKKRTRLTRSVGPLGQGEIDEERGGPSMKNLSIASFVFGMAFIGLAPSMGAQQEKAPVQELRLGGYAILFRHGETD